MVDRKGQTYIYNSQNSKLEPHFKLKGDKINKTYMLNSGALSNGSTRKNESNKVASLPKSNLLYALSEETTVQIWDVNGQNSEAKNPLWKAKNVPNDELDLTVPIYDTSMTTFKDKSGIEGRVLAVCTAFGQVRLYDIRSSLKPQLDCQILKNSQEHLTHVVASEKNENQMYVVTREGHPILCDRRFNCRVVRKMPGARGSVRDAKVISHGTDAEYVLTAGCDRYLRLFDAAQDQQKDCLCGTAYLKQKLNCILLGEP